MTSTISKVFSTLFQGRTEEKRVSHEAIVVALHNNPRIQPLAIQCAHAVQTFARKAATAKFLTEAVGQVGEGKDGEVWLRDQLKSIQNEIAAFDAAQVLAIAHIKALSAESMPFRFTFCRFIAKGSAISLCVIRVMFS